MSETEASVPAEQGDRVAATGSMPQELARSTAEISSMRRAVESQSLRLDPAAGDKVRAMLEDHLSKVDAWLKQAGDLTRQAPLGQNPVGTAMAAKFAGRADGGEHSLAHVLHGYRKVLEDAHDAIGDAMRTYRDADEHAADGVRKLI